MEKVPTFMANQKSKHMKNFHRLMTVVFCSATLFFFVTAQKDLDLGFGLFMLIVSFIFCCFSIMEEQKEEISRLRNKVGRLK